MTFTALALAHLLASCKASHVAVGTQVSIIAVESGGNPYTLHDNATGRAYYPASRAQASAIAHELIDVEGHSVDVGLGQFNSGNFAGWGVTADDMLDPCLNVNVTGAFLEQQWIRAFSAVGFDRARERQAIFMTASLYNKNSLYGAPSYVNSVVAASRTRYVRIVTAAFHAVTNDRPKARTTKRIKPVSHAKLSLGTLRYLECNRAFTESEFVGSVGVRAVS